MNPSTSPRASYSSDISDAEWEFCAPYLTLMVATAPQREHSLREVLNAVRWCVRTGSQWRLLPHDFPPWAAVYQQMRRWFAAGSFEAMAAELRAILRVAAGREDVVPTAVVLDSRTLQSTPESGARAGYDGYKRRKGSKVHLAVDTLGHLLALKVTPADVQDRAEAGPLAAAVQTCTGDNVTLAYVDQGYTGENPAAAAATHGVKLAIVRCPAPKHGFVLMHRRWVVERTQAWAARFRRLARDHERLAPTLASFHWLALSSLLLRAASRQCA